MKKTIIATALTLLSFNIFSQTEIPEPDKKYKFGFDFGLNFSYLVVNKPLPISYNISNGIGARLGILSEFKITDLLYLSPKAEVSFNNAKIEYDNLEDPYRVMPVTLELMAPVLIKINKLKWSPYFFAGPNLKIPIVRNTPFNQFFKPSSDFSIDLGAGLEQRFTHFRFSPELRFSFGFLNVNRDPGLNYLYHESISLVLKFIE